MLHRLARKNSRKGKPWRAREVQKIKSLAKANTPSGLIAYVLDRTKRAVYAKAGKKRISLKPANRSQYNRRKRR